VILIFFLFTLATFFVVIEILQSDTTARNITKTINKITKERYGTSLDIEKLEFQLFPPGILARNVKVKYSKSDLDISLDSLVVGAFIDLRDVFLDKPTISEVLINDAKVTIRDHEKKTSDNNFTKLEISNYINLINDALPINLLKVNLSKIHTFYNDKELSLEKVLLRKRKDTIKLSGTFYNFNIGDYIDYKKRIDEIDTTVVLSDDEINIKKISIKDGISEISAKGLMKNSFKDIKIKGKLDLDTDISVVSEYVNLSKIGELNYGKLKSNSTFEIDNKKFSVNSKIAINDFLTDFAFGESLQMALVVNDNEVLFENFMLKNKNQKLELLEPFQFYSFKQKEFVPNTVMLSAQTFNLDNALRYLRESLSILNSTISGNLQFDLNDDGFDIRSKDIEIQNLKLGKASKPILAVPKGNIRDSVFTLAGREFKMATIINLPNTNLEVTGSISDKKIEFSSNEGEIDLEDFERFAGFKLKGRGKLKLDVSNINGNIIKVLPELNDFEFEGYKMAKIKTNLYFDLDKDSIYINGLDGEEGKASFKGDAKINYNNLKLQANINIESKRFYDIKRTLNPLIGELSFLPDEIYGDWKINTKISGLANLEEIVVENKISGDNNYIFDESFEKIMFNLNVIKQNIEVKDIYLKKSIGRIKGNLNYNLKNEELDYNISVNNLPIKELSLVDKSPLDLEATVDGEFLGKKNKKETSIRSQLRLKNTYIAGRKIKDTTLNSLIEGDDYKLNLNLFGGELLLDANIFSDKRKQSSIKLNVDTSDIPLYFSVLKFVDKSTLNIDGRVRMNSSVTFPGFNYNKSNFQLVLNQFLFKKDRVDIDYNYRSDNPQFLIEDGVIKNWDLELEGRKFYLISKGVGDLKSKFDITNSFKVDASILETFNKVISKSNGTIRGKFDFYNRGRGQDYNAKLLSNNLSFSTSLLPTEIKNTKLEIDYKDKTFIIKSLLAKLSAGDVSLGGTIGIANIVPDFNLRLRVREAGFPVLRKSNVVISGDTTIIGSKPPFTVAGDIVIDKLLVVNDINDFTSGKDAIIKKQFEYLPSETDKRFDNFLNFNINISTKEALRLSNSFADVGMVGDLQLLGGDNDPKLVGSLELAPRVNKITFKNNEYTLSKGNVFFYQQNKMQNPELDFIASTNINDYKINLKVYGPVKSFNLDLSSTPALAQEDILSLIAFGYTKDLSANLTDAERESMTQAGVGSILFDSFKINETLKSEFGLQVNLGTQIQQNEASLLNQRNSDGTRVRSATTIEVKKKLSDAMSLSVSSTVGGSAGQRQSMNLNYNISNKVSVEGVYETRTAPEGEEAIINDTSLGADVKWRWSFK
jgi:translocation and assembly module TamB